MTNNSATGGIINPLGTAPDYDDAFDDFLQDVVAQLTGLEGSLVRPRWQPIPPKLPDPSASWAAIGITDATPLAMRAQIVHNPAGQIAAPGDGLDVLTSWERTAVLLSTYGPKAWELQGFVADGLRIPQNNEALLAARIALQGIGARRTLSSVFPQNVIVRRIDCEFTFNRAIVRSYPVFNLLSVHGAVNYRANGSARDASETFEKGQ